MLLATIHRVALLVALSTVAQATDLYVDAVNGNDANSGTSPAAAWRTLTRASQLAPVGSAHTIRAAPGSYSESIGEVFPLVFRQQVLVSEAGSAATRIQSLFGSTTFSMSYVSGGLPSGPSRIEGFTIETGGTGIDVQITSGVMNSEVRDCTILAGGRGVRLASLPPFGSFAVELTRVRIEGATVGIDVTGDGTDSSLIARETVIRSCLEDGLRVDTYASLISVQLIGCRIEQNGGHGVSARAEENFGWAGISLEDCLLARNGGAGFWAVTLSGNPTGVAVIFLRCTVANNQGPGVSSFFNPSGLSSVYFRGTLVHGQTPDVAVSRINENTASQIGGPDPLFVDPANGDFRLRFGSPCIDRGVPWTSGQLDLAGVARPIDGDLDALESGDIGAYEHEPLRLVTTGALGTPLRLEMSGPSGGSTTVYFSRGPLVTPMSTPFGQFDLNPAAFGALFTGPVAPFPPAVFQRPIPNQAVLLGRTFSFQARTQSALAPQGSAYTNPVQFVVVP